MIASDFRTTDVDLIFIKAKKKGERRINYTRFLDALGMIAIQKYSDMVSNMKEIPVMVLPTDSSIFNVQPLEASVPKLLEAHFVRLPCVQEFADGNMVS